MAPTLKHSRFSRAAYDPWFQHIKPPDNYSLPSVTAYHILSMFGFATCLLFTGTILFSRRVQRHKSVPNFFGFLAFSAFMHNLTWFTGHVNIFQTKNPPPFALCYFQSSMIAGLSTGQGLAAVFLVFQVSSSLSPRPHSERLIPDFPSPSLKRFGSRSRAHIFQANRLPTLTLWRDPYASGQYVYRLDSMAAADNRATVLCRAMGGVADICHSECDRTSMRLAQVRTSSPQLLPLPRSVDWIPAASGPIRCTAPLLTRSCKSVATPPTAVHS